MERAKALKAVEKLTTEGYEASIYENYSGRGMFGADTTAVVVEGPWSENIVKDVPALKKLRADSLGHDTIYY